MCKCESFVLPRLVWARCREIRCDAKNVKNALPCSDAALFSCAHTPADLRVDAPPLSSLTSFRCAQPMVNKVNRVVATICSAVCGMLVVLGVYLLVHDDLPQPDPCSHFDHIELCVETCACEWKCDTDFCCIDRSNPQLWRVRQLVDAPQFCDGWTTDIPTGSCTVASDKTYYYSQIQKDGVLRYHYCVDHGLESLAGGALLVVSALSVLCACAVIVDDWRSFARRRDKAAAAAPMEEIQVAGPPRRNRVQQPDQTQAPEADESSSV